ncbi:hypothetical protein D049_2935A, partial [Vibrio parahaemolyticus VPTS-2010]
MVIIGVNFRIFVELS